MIRRLLIGIIRIYQRWISPIFAPSCRFHPSCSEYACQAIEKHGPLKGVALGVWRILRCAPWSKGGFDPVP